MKIYRLYLLNWDHQKLNCQSHSICMTAACYTEAKQWPQCRKGMYHFLTPSNKLVHFFSYFRHTPYLVYFICDGTDDDSLWMIPLHSSSNSKTVGGLVLADTSPNWIQSCSFKNVYNVCSKLIMLPAVSGVSQGSVLGLTLMSVRTLLSTPAVMLCWQSMSLSVIRSTEDYSRLQEDSDKISTWVNSSMLTLIWKNPACPYFHENLDNTMY